MNQEQLIKECKQGSAAAQKCLYDLYAEPMFMTCRRYLKTEADAEERMLDGFYKFFTHLSGFRYQGEAALYGFIKRIMINECLMFLRKKNPFELTAETDDLNLAVPDDVFSKLEADEIFKLIIRLPVGYRTVFNLYAVEGMTHKEIAALLKISEGTSKSQLSKAKALLQKMLNNENEQHESRKIN
jgi:RNA polymerase sigma-70 factor (ECF subfamily)